MTKPIFHIDQHVFERTLSGSIVAGIRVKLEECWFPADEWDDFAAIILTAALKALQHISEEVSESELVHFMEGPFSLEFSRIDQTRMMINAIDRTRRNAVRQKQTVTQQELAQNLFATGYQLLDWCMHRGWAVQDMSDLAQCLDQLARSDQFVLRN